MTPSRRNDHCQLQPSCVPQAVSSSPVHGTAVPLQLVQLQPAISQDWETECVSHAGGVPEQPLPPFQLQPALLQGDDVV